MADMPDQKTEPRASMVLVIPDDGDPRGLLGDRESAAWRCGARPPAALLPPWPGARWSRKGGRRDQPDWDHVDHGWTFALVIVFAGEVVKEGCAYTPNDGDYEDAFLDAKDAQAGKCGWENTCFMELGRLVFADAAGEEITR